MEEIGRDRKKQRLTGRDRERERQEETGRDWDRESAGDGESE